MSIDKVRIIETSLNDLNNVVSLWNDGDVMHFVGFPNGLGVTYDSLKSNWLPNVNVDDRTKHYSIYHNEIGYCGESFYTITDEGKGMLDIKLFPKARGKGIAFQGLKHAIENAFELGKATTVFVDPHRKNEEALKLYQKFGFTEFEHPDLYESEEHYYFELNLEDFRKAMK